MKKVLSLAVLCLIQGCEQSEKMPLFIDKLVFSAVGSTVFSKPDQVTMQKIHLDKGALVGKDVMIEGKVLKTGRYDTYMVMSDETARMLVVLTDVDVKVRALNREIKSGQFPVRIIGTVEYGKKGLPFIQAKSLRLNPKEGSSFRVTAG